MPVIAPTIAVSGYKRYQVEVAFKNNGLELCGRYIACQTTIATAICSLLPAQCSSATAIWNMYKSLDQCVNSWEALAKLFVLAYEMQVLGIATIPLLLDDGRCLSSTSPLRLSQYSCNFVVLVVWTNSKLWVFFILRYWNIASAISPAIHYADANPLWPHYPLFSTLTGSYRNHPCCILEFLFG